MTDLRKKIIDLTQILNDKLNATSTLKELEKIRISFLGKKGLITTFMAELKNLSMEEKRVFGPLLNKFKKSSHAQITAKKEEIIEHNAQKTTLKKQNFDVTAYKPKTFTGNTHLYTKFIEKIENIFISMGFNIFNGPEVENDFYNFTALNIPQDHPARDMMDTFWLNKKKLLLRTHTSTVQIHAMQNNSLPLAGVSTGRVFRHEATDATHDFMFWQCEGILIDKNITLSNLFAVAKKFLQTLFKKKTLDIRIRPGFFPFVEPGLEIDMRCPFCKHGCSVCKKTTWIEVFPAGLIHPNVLKAVNIDSEKYSGFAFGFGLTRLAMLQYGINDIRYFHSGKYKFLEQF
jgi:phenylalanyl-tRNA synthetase alpha chain